MKYIKQILIILLFTFTGELLQAMIPLPVPAAIYGLVLLFLALCSGILKPSGAVCCPGGKYSGALGCDRTGSGGDLCDCACIHGADLCHCRPCGRMVDEERR